MKAGVVIEPWKLEVFRKHLTDAAFKFSEAGLLHRRGLLLLHVETSEAMKPLLQSTLEKAMAECRRLGPPNQ